MNSTPVTVNDITRIGAPDSLPANTTAQFLSSTGATADTTVTAVIPTIDDTVFRNHTQVPKIRSSCPPADIFNAKNVIFSSKTPSSDLAVVVPPKSQELVPTNRRAYRGRHHSLRTSRCKFGKFIKCTAFTGIALLIIASLGMLVFIGGVIVAFIEQ